MRTAPFDTGNVLLLGTDQKEWGGGLERIDTMTGAVSEVPGLGGPINGVGPEPGRPECLVATVGLVHFFPSGQVVEVCGDKMRRLYYKPYTIDANWPADPPKLPFETVPFYALAQARGALWIAGGDGLYTITANRPIAFRKLPPFEQVDGVDVSFAVPGLAMVRTDIDARVSLGGGAPCLLRADPTYFLVETLFRPNPGHSRITSGFPPSATRSCQRPGRSGSADALLHAAGSLKRGRSSRNA